MISFREGDDESSEDLSSRLYQKIRETIGAKDFETWFQRTRCIFASPDTLVLTTASDFHRRYIEQAYGDLLLATARSLARIEPRLVFEVERRASRFGSPSAEPTAKPPSREPFGVPGSEHRAATTGTPALARLPLTFVNFVTGKASHLAYAAALAVAEDPGNVYNPLYLHGDSGTGKTHLLQAIRQSITSSHTHLKQSYVTAEEFEERLSLAAEKKELSAFRKRYRGIDVLLFDDLQFVRPRSRAQEELFHTVSTLLSRDRQVVIAANRKPADLKGLERLVSRLEGGLVAPISQPTEDCRLKLLLAKARARGYELSRETAEFLAANTTTVREIEGALATLLHLAREPGAPSGLELARRALAEIETDRPRSTAITLDSILELCEEYYGIKQKDLLSASKRRSLVYARQVGMYLARELTPLSLQQIGVRFGGRDHSTVLYAQTRIMDHLRQNPQVRAEIEVLRARLTEGRS